MTHGDISSLLDRVRARPQRCVLFTDFDGTLSPIVEVPADARLLDGAAEVLSALATSLLDLVVVSGRPVEFLARQLPPEVSIVGLYGLEGRRHGHRWEHPTSGSWREVVADISTCATSTGPSGMRVEPKGISLTLHYRGHPELAAQVEELGRSLAARSGLEMRPARMSVELHPPLSTDKGSVVERFASDAEVVIFAGDDVGDLPAFDALDRLAANGVEVARLAVRSAEAPDELIDRADLVLDGPDAVLDLLHSISPLR